MVTKFIVGNSYSKEEIEEDGFIKTKQSSLYYFYRKDNILMIFDHPKPKIPNQYKLKSIFVD